MVSKHKEKAAFIDDRLDLLEKSGLYRRLRSVTVHGPTATVDGREVVHLCSNDYLGLSRNKSVIKRAIGAMLEEVSQCSSRLIAGNHPSMAELEVTLAGHRGTEAALVYPTGYTANLGVVTAVADKNSTIFSDELNHASIIDACRLSGATIKVFEHNNVDILRKLMRRSKGRKIVIIEGIYSMDGDSARVSEICTVARENDAITIVDDAHGDFVFGPNFSGIPAKFGVDVDIHISSMSKALGCFGGYVATTRSLRELLINTSRQFIYTSALPAHLCAAAIAAVPLAKRGNLQKMLYGNIYYFTKAMKKLGFVIGNSSSQIIPVLIGSERAAVSFSKELLLQGVFAQAIRYPTVKKGSARLRVSLTAMHDQEHLDHAIGAFEKAGKKMGII
ncbi:MAG TPA: 8-amino-7-oxononanoate synthase [Nitrososphaera sp.]|nr:8-amino-7-oxononanoate synthase [Nitrososphaera sp.]